MVVSLVDEFQDYPMPQKATNWTIPNAKKLVRDRPLRETNQTRDIDGAVPGTTVYFKARKFTDKPNLFTTSDIFGATTPVLHPQRNKPLDASLRTSDIPHCAPGLIHMSTHRTVDPLHPVYSLPSINVAVSRKVIHEAEQQAQRSPPRDSMKLSDIQGTKAKLAYTRLEPHDPLDYSDVPRHAHEKRSHRASSMALDVHDINTTSSIHLDTISKRRTSPLEPRYVVQLPGKNHQTAVVGDVPGSKSVPPKPLRKDQPMLSLRSDDVDGARPGDPYKKKSYY